MTNENKDRNKSKKQQEEDKELAKQISSSGEVFEMATTNEEEKDKKRKLEKIKDDMRKKHP